MNEELVSTNTNEFKESPYRYVDFALYMTNLMVIGTFVSAFTPIENSLLNSYDVNVTQILSASSQFLFGNVLISIFVFPICQKLGIRHTQNLALIIAFLGCLLRLSIHINFNLVILGQTLLGISAGLQLNILINFCYQWFHPKTRPIFLSLLSISNVIGGGIGNYLPIFFVDNDETDPIINRKQIIFYLQSMTAAYVVITVVNIVFFKGEPGEGYGYKVKIEHEDKGHFFLNLWHYIKSGFSSKKYVMFIIINCFVNTALVSFGVVANILAVYFGMSSSVGGILTLVVIFVGLISSIRYSVVNMKYKYHYMRQVKYLSISVISMFLVFFFLVQQQILLFLFFAAIFGATCFQVTPLIMELITRDFQDIPLDISNCLVFTSAQILEVIVLNTLGFLRKKVNYAFYIHITFIQTTFVIAIFLFLHLDKYPPKFKQFLQ